MGRDKARLDCFGADALRKDQAASVARNDRKRSDSFATAWLAMSLMAVWVCTSTPAYALSDTFQETFDNMTNGATVNGVQG